MKKTSLIFAAMILALAAGCSEDKDDCSSCESPKVCILIDNKAECVQPCPADDMRCSGNKVERCNGITWDTLTTCTGACVKNGGLFSCQEDAASCTADDMRCNGDVLELCDGTGWFAQPCNGKCVENNGLASCQEDAASCTAGTKRCNGNALELCDGTSWTAQPCNGNCVESNDQVSCVETPSSGCAAGQTKCEDDGTQAVLSTCNASGTWDKTPCPASTVEGARLTCKNANSCSSVICNEGTFYNSESNSCQEYNHSNACQAGRTYCNGKTNFLYECLETDNESPLLATDCGKEGKVCVKIDDDNAQCMVEECNGNFCEGEVLHYCTDDHKIDTELGTMDCTESDRICDINELGYAECLYPECIEEGKTDCVEDDNTKLATCTNKRWVFTDCTSGTCNDGVCK